MNHELKPYPEYKESELPWLGCVPAGWNVLRGKSVFRAVDIRSKTGQEELLTVSANYGIVPRKQTTVTMFKAKSYVGHKLCWPGDLVVNSLWAWMQGLGVSRHHGLISSAYSVYRPRTTYANYGSFFHYLLRSSVYRWELQTRSKGVWISRLQLSDLAFMDMPILLPSDEEQAAIVRFLDHANRRIEKAIRAKRKLIALLNEQKQVIIHQAVTRGLDPNVPMKDSGVPWLGEIPAHWGLVSAKQVSKIFVPQRDKPNLNEQAGTPWITPEYIGGKDVSPSTSFVDATSIRQSNIRQVPAGSVIASCVGRFGIASINPTPVIINQQLQAYIPSPAIDARYLRLFIQVSKLYFEREGNSTTLPYVNRQGFGDMPLILPGRSEQEAIVHQIENEVNKIEETISRTDREIELIREYRTRLIADVVTGKLDVREAAAGLPDLEEPAESLEEVTDLEEELDDIEGEGEE